jgi:hypothetical protein
MLNKAGGTYFLRHFTVDGFAEVIERSVADRQRLEDMGRRNREYAERNLMRAVQFEKWREVLACAATTTGKSAVGEDSKAAAVESVAGRSVTP